MTPRAVENIKSVDMIAAEDTVLLRSLNHFEINKMISYHKFNEKRVLKALIC